MSDWDTPAATGSSDTWGAPKNSTSADATWGANNDANGASMWDAGQSGETQGDATDRGGANDRACFNCGQPGHNKADCPNPRSMVGMICRNCNKEGHMSKECPEGMECRYCKKQGHMAKDCPEKPPAKCRRCGEDGHMVKDCPQPEICRNCGEEGHGAAACKSARKVDRSCFPDMSTEDAWKLIVKATGDRELDDVKDAVQIYLKASPDTTYVQLEEAFRSQDLNIWLIAIEKPYLAATMTNMDLQGNMDKKYTVTYRFSPKPTRPRERDVWPETPEQNMERLADAGEVVNRGVTKCSNCEELGHSAKFCPQPKNESPAVRVVKCYNCDGEGHRVRDCPVPRVDRFACRNCGKSGHNSKECTEPRSAEGVECRKCGEMGHFSKDCPTGGGGGGCRNCGQEGHKAADCTEPRNMDKVQCRNCDEFGHVSKECPKPRDYSRVKCSNCQQMGHTKVRCKNPLVPEDDGGFDGNDNGTEAGAKDEGTGWPSAGEDASAVDANAAW